MEEVDKAWLAAAIDGEGSIAIHKRVVQISIHNTNRQFLEKAYLLFNNSGGIWGQPNKKSGVICYRFVITRQDLVLDFLKQLIPFLIIKKSNAQLCIRFLEDKFAKLDVAVPELKHSGHVIAGKNGNHHLKGNRGNSEQHKKAACSESSS